MSAIRNIVFDIGNVFVRWDPLAIVEAAFGISGDDALARRQAIFADNDIWRALNRGEYTQDGARDAYVEAGLFTQDEAHGFFAAVYDSFHLLEDTPPLLERLVAADYRTFALTDNVIEVVAHLSQTHDWWAHFEGVTNSAEVGVLKPDPAMYAHVLETNGLAPHETVFFDDMPRNVDGAKAAGMHACLFTDAAQAERDLATLGVQV